MSKRPIEIHTNGNFFELDIKEVFNLVNDTITDTKGVEAFIISNGYNNPKYIEIYKKPELMEPSVFSTGKVISIERGIVNKDWKVKTKDKVYRDLSVEIRKGLLEEKGRRKKYYSELNEKMEKLRKYINKNIKESGKTGLEDFEGRIESYLKRHE